MQVNFNNRHLSAPFLGDGAPLERRLCLRINSNGRCYIKPQKLLYLLSFCEYDNVVIIRTRNFLFLVAGWIFVALGIIGLFLPVMPTTPFLIAAAYFFSRGSPKWHRWLITRPILGKLLDDWEKDGIIPRRAKAVSVFMIVVSFLSMFWLINAPLWARMAMLTVGVLVSGFILSRPSTRP